MDNDEIIERTPRLIAALMGCGVAALLVTVVGAGVLIAGIEELGIGRRGPSNYEFVYVVVPIGVVLLIVATALWTSIARLARGSRRGTRPMLACLTAVGALPIAIVLPVAIEAPTAPLVICVAVFAAVLLGSAAWLGSVVGATAPSAA